jgi:integrase/recombinase XerD
MKAYDLKVYDVSRTWTKCIPIRLWPPADQAAWEAAVRPSDPFESGGIALRWSAATRRKTAAGYGRYLYWLRERGELDETTDPAARITRERLTAYLDELRRTNRGHTIQTRIQELGDAMGALAPNSDWRFIKRAAGRLRANTVPARDKRGRLTRIVDPIAQGYRMMEEAEKTSTISELGRAAFYRDGLILVFLAYHPWRLRNLASLRIGQHLLVQEDRIILKVEASETKARNSWNRNFHRAYLWR